MTNWLLHVNLFLGGQVTVFPRLWPYLFDGGRGHVGGLALCLGNLDLVEVLGVHAPTHWFNSLVAVLLIFSFLEVPEPHLSKVVVLLERGVASVVEVSGGV